MAFPAVLWLAVTATLLGAFEYGYSMGVLNTVLDRMAEELSFSSAVGGAVVVSVLLLGAAAGALGAGMFADAVGTKRAQVLNVLFFVGGGALSAVTPKHQFCWSGLGQMNGCVPTALFIGRILTGFGAGCASLYTPRYLAEIAPVKFRGSMGGWYQVMVNLGILCGYLAALPYGFDFGAFKINGVMISWWRVMLALTIVPAIVQLALFTFCPESPVWLEWKGRKSDAATVRLALWGEQGNWLAEPLLGSIESPHHSHSHLHSHGHSHNHGHSRNHSLSGPFSHHNHHHSHGRPSRSHSSSHLYCLDPSGSGILHSTRSHSSSHLPYHEPSTPGVVSGLTVNGAISIDISCSSRVSIDSRDALLDALLPNTKDQVEEKQGSAEGWGALFKKQYRWMVILAIGVPVLQQLSGVNTVVLYSSQLFAQAGVNDPLAGTIYTGAVNLVFTAISSPFVDQFGRRPLLLTSFVGMTVCLTGLALSALGHAAWMGTVSLICILAFMMFFAGGAGPIPWIYLAEILPESVKGRFAALATALAWIVNLAIGMTFPIMLDAMGVSACYFVYAGLNVVGVVFIYFFLVETKCMTMEHIFNKLLLSA